MSGRTKTGKIMKCAFCGTEKYVPKNYQAIFKYCSYKCKGLAERQTAVTECKTCGKEFSHISSRVNSAKYCSRKCYHTAMSKKGTVSYTCAHCGKEFFASPSSNRKYCSRECVNKPKKEIWNPKFESVRKNMIVRGLVTHCARCGYNEEPKILGVHHKDRNRNNNSLENLEVLCPTCHSLEHLKHVPHGFQE